MFRSIEELGRLKEETGMSTWQIIAACQNELNLADAEEIAQQTAEGSIREMLDCMAQRYEIMKKGARDGISNPNRSRTGLSGGDAYRLEQYLESGKAVTSLTGRAAALSMAINEVNAVMGRIVAAPTAGSCGILPGVLIAAQEWFSYTDEQMAQALLTAGGVGMVIAVRATISGAEGGCQAECGSAAAMAAFALTELRGGTFRQCADALALVMKSVMGLVCDPVAGLVEVPCVKRNAFGAAQAVLASDMVLAGIESVIPADEVIDTMKTVGSQLPPALRETADGGVAVAPTAIAITQRLKETGVL